MEIQQVTIEKYKEIFQQTYQIFNSPNFAELNKEKSEEILFLVFYKDNKPKLGIIAGTSNRCLSSPFSAPYGGFSYCKDDVKISIIEEAINLLEAFALKKDINLIKLVLPPEFYHSSFIAKQINVLIRSNFLISTIDLNYQFYTEDFSENYLNEIWYNARYHYKKSLEYKLDFQKQETLEGKKLVYDVIQENRLKRGFPLRMTWNQVFSTTEIIPADFFLLSHNKDYVASAIIFHVAPKMVQVIYWGGLPDFAKYKTMNFLSYSIFDYYQKLGIKIIDIGTSTENGIPNYGLCEFKESIGCRISTKLSFVKSI